MTMFGIIFLGGAVALAAVALLGNAAAWQLEKRRELHRER